MAYPGREGTLERYITLLPKVDNRPILICWLKTFGYLNLYWFVETFSVQTFSPIILIYRWDNFVYSNWGCTSIYHPLSCLFSNDTQVLFLYNLKPAKDPYKASLIWETIQYNRWDPNRQTKKRKVHILMTFVEFLLKEF